MMAAGLALTQLSMWGQTPAQPVAVVEQPDAHRTRDELSQILQRCPPTLRNVLALDPTLLTNQAYLAPYPKLAAFLNAHPEIVHNPVFYVGEPPQHERYDAASQANEMWRRTFDSVGIFLGFGMAISVIIWLIRTLVDYRRWSRLAKVQTDVHTKLLDRFTSNEDLIAYIQTPAGAKFLESTPIKLDAAPKAMGAPLGRILWALQGGLVMMAGGIGLQIVSGRVGNEAAQPLNALGVLALALGVGFVISAIISYVISWRLGLIEPAAAESRDA
ncbi:MAG TPA: hypothetical protein VGK29_11210 [Paludibaculum sp.]|jgi:hypothetical protein